MNLMKMFSKEDSFMFRFEGEPGQPDGDNHKVIPTYRMMKKLDKTTIVEIVRRFLSLSEIAWYDFLGVDIGPIYNSAKYGESVCISACKITHNGITRKVIWLLTKEDVDEINGFVQDGNHRTSIRSS